MVQVEEKSGEFRRVLGRVQEDFGWIKFVAGQRFFYRYPATVGYEQVCECGELRLLHEVGHAIKMHKDFVLDVERLKMEREAWEETRKLAKKYGVVFDEDFVEMEMDSYRNWLHQRSSCKRCGLTGFQTRDGVYHCPVCDVLKNNPDLG